MLRIIDLERKLLQAQSGYLDALWEINQAQADLAAALGDPTLGVIFSQPPEAPEIHLATINADAEALADRLIEELRKRNILV